MLIKQLSQYAVQVLMHVHYLEKLQPQAVYVSRLCSPCYQMTVCTALELGIQV